MSKAAKRSMKIKLTGGRVVRVLDWIDELDKDLPQMVDTTNQQPFNHRKAMREFFMRDGVDAVVKYCDTMMEIANDNLRQIDSIEKAKKEYDQIQAQNTGG